MHTIGCEKYVIVLQGSIDSFVNFIFSAVVFVPVLIGENMKHSSHRINKHENSITFFLSFPRSPC